MRAKFYPLLLVLLFSACQENETLSPQLAMSDRELIAAAKDNFEEDILASAIDYRGKKRNYRGELLKTVNWNDAYVKQLSVGRGVVAPIVYLEDKYIKNDRDGSTTSLNQMTYLLSYRDQANQIHFEVVIEFPNVLSDPEDAIQQNVIVEDWSGNFLKGYQYKSGKIFDLVENGSVSNGKMAVICTDTDWYTCVYAGDVFYGCEYDYTETTCVWVGDGGGGSGGGGSGGGTGGGDYGGGGSGGTSVILVGGPSSAVKITDKKIYFNCFDKSSPARLSIYADQPIANSNTAYSGTNVGHAWLTITQTINGTAVTRSFGFYPNGIVTPTAPSEPSVLVNDSGHAFDVRLSFAITAQELSNLINYVTNNLPSTYNLNSMNCTDFVVDACGAAGLLLPQNVGTWPGGSGLNPGRFGQDLRTVDLSNKIESRDLDGGTALSNSLGNCSAVEP